MRVEVENLSKYYGDFCAVDNISFSFESGEIFSIIGRNGSGKTSTIRMMLGTLAKSEGKVNFNGQPVNKMLNRIGYLAEERGLFEKDPIENQLVYFATLKGMNKREAKKQVEYWLDRIGLLNRSKEKLGNLSKGNQQKIQLINSLIHNPDVVIFDEPFSGLDPVNASFLINLIIELKKENKCIMLSSHQLHLLDDVCDRILIINNSRVKYYGNVENLKENYGSEYVKIRVSAPVATDYTEFNKLFDTNMADGECTIFVKDKFNPGDIFNYLMKRNINVNFFETKRKTLHDIFVEMVGDKNE